MNEIKIPIARAIVLHDGYVERCLRFEDCQGKDEIWRYLELCIKLSMIGTPSSIPGKNTSLIIA